MNSKRENTCITTWNKVREKGEWVIVAMSLGNPYFTKKRIVTILSDLSENNHTAPIVTTLDNAALHTYKGIYVDSKKAEKKRKKQKKTLENNIRNAIIETNYQHEDIVKTMERIEKQKEYQHALHTVMNIFKQNEKFSTQALAETKKILTNKLQRTHEQHSWNADEAVHYLLKEIAFLWSSPKIFKKPTAFLYHKDFDIFTQFMSNEFFSEPIIKDIWFIKKSY